MSASDHVTMPAAEFEHRLAKVHTPGPWHVDPFKHHANGNFRVLAHQCTPVAVVPEHLLADARLIAAAPDLLEALEQARAALPDAWHAVQCDVPVEVLQLIDAAIAKATGGAR
jgi:hypothetical protein